MGRSPGFGSMSADLFAQLTLGFPSAPLFSSLTLPATITRRTVLQKVRGSTHKVVPPIVNTGFQVLFHSPPGVLFTFPSQYYALSVTKEYLALRGGPRVFRQGSTCLVLLWILLASDLFRLQGCYLLRLYFPELFGYKSFLLFAVRNPEVQALRFGLFPVRSPLLGKSRLISLPGAT